MLRIALIAGMLMTSGTALAKREAMTQAEEDHYAALRVFMDSKEKKAYTKLKTTAERDAWLKEQGLWDRFYQYDESKRQKILDGDVWKGWTYDMVLMAWGAPHSKRRITGRQAQRSEMYTYKFEVDAEGHHLIWTPDSKATVTASRFYRVELMIDDGRVTEMEKKEGWD